MEKRGAKERREEMIRAEHGRKDESRKGTPNIKKAPNGKATSEASIKEKSLS